MTKPLRKGVSELGRHKTVANRFELKLPGNDNYNGMVELMEDIKKIVNQSIDNGRARFDSTDTESRGTPSKLNEMNSIIRRPSEITKRTVRRAPVKKAVSEKLG